jgi:hypothetical protein
VTVTSLNGCIGDDEPDLFSWSPPIDVWAIDPRVDDANGTLNMDITLTGEFLLVTQWDGTLTVMIRDSDLVELYNRSFGLKRNDFVVTDSKEGMIDTYYPLAIPLGDITRSNDRMINKARDGLGWDPGRSLTIATSFAWDDEVIGPKWDWLHTGTLEIPDILLNPNRAPNIMVLVPPDIWTYADIHFDGSPTTDDSPLSSLKYQWEWGDGTDPTIDYSLEANHMFKIGGFREVNLTVTDRDGATSMRTFLVNARWSTQVTIDKTGVVTEPGVRYNDTYVEIRVMNISPHNIQPDFPWPKLCSGNGSETHFNGTNDEVPTIMRSGDSFEMILYFTSREDFAPFYLVMWNELTVLLE